MFTPVSAGNFSHPQDLHITVDPRIELLAVVEYLSDYDSRSHLITRFDIQYKADIEKAFHPFRLHQAVKLFDQMSSDSFNFHSPPAAMLYLSAPPELDVQIPYRDDLIEHAGGVNQLGQFLSALHNLAKESNFMDFYQSQSALYEAIVSETTAQLYGKNDLVAVLEAYFGMKQYSYHLILSPLYHDGGFGPRVDRENGLAEIYSIIGPSGMNAQKQPTFGEPRDLRYLTWHEFSHPFVNPLTEQYLREVNQYQSLYQSLDKGTIKFSYGNWAGAVSEHIVRAVTVRLAARELGDAKGQACLDAECEHGFVYIDLLVERLKHYEEQRDRYPTFRDFYLELIKGFAGAEPLHKTPVDK